MKTAIKTVIAVAALGLFVGSAGAADIKNSTVETNVKAEKLNQSASGFASSNKLEAGSVGDKDTKIKNSKVKTNVTVKDVNQSSSGFASSNDVKLGNVK
ncbi:MAG: GLUG motif-containing protein [Pseudomonadota bacterium]